MPYRELLTPDSWRRKQLGARPNRDTVLNLLLVATLLCTPTSAAFFADRGGVGTADVLTRSAFPPTSDPPAFYGHIISVSSTTTCAIAAWSVPMPSGVFALIPTCSGGTPNNSATLC